MDAQQLTSKSNEKHDGSMRDVPTINFGLVEAQFVEAGLSAPQNLTPEELPSIYFSDENCTIFVRESRGHFKKLPMGMLSTALKLDGVSLPTDPDERSMAISTYMEQIIKHNSVDYVGVLSGYPAGVTETPSGSRILCTCPPRPCEPAEGDWTPLKHLFEAIIPNPDALNAFLSRLKVGFADYRRSCEVGPYAANIRATQILILVGDPGSGKTFAMNLVASLFGGVVADPYPYLTGSTDFNQDVAKAGLLLADDPPASINPGARRRLQQGLKQIAVGNEMRIHPKGRLAIHAKVANCIALVCNEDSLDVLPKFEPAFMDKCHLIKVEKSEKILALERLHGREKWTRMLQECVPSFAWFLLHEFEIPEEIQDVRYGVKAYHDASLLADADDQSEYAVLWRDITRWIIDYVPPRRRGEDRLPPSTIAEIMGPDHVWHGTSAAFKDWVEKMDEKQRWGKLFPYQNSAGMVLGELSRQFPDNVEKGKLRNGNRIWRIEYSIPDIPKSRSEAD